MPTHPYTSRSFPDRKRPHARPIQTVLAQKPRTSPQGKKKKHSQETHTHAHADTRTRKTGANERASDPDEDLQPHSQLTCRVSARTPLRARDGGRVNRGDNGPTTPRPRRRGRLHASCRLAGRLHSVASAFSGHFLQGTFFVVVGGVVEVVAAGRGSRSSSTAIELMIERMAVYPLFKRQTNRLEKNKIRPTQTYKYKEINTSKH